MSTNVIDFRKLARRVGMTATVFKKTYMAAPGAIVTLADGSRFKFIDTIPGDMRDGLWQEMPST